MNDSISRQAAIDAIERLILPQAKGETAAEEINRIAWRCAINCAEEMIGHLPTIDAVPVVRCKDCVWCHAGYCEKYDDLIPFGCADKPWEDWFCADGERSEE